MTLWLAAITARAHEPWQVLRDCRVVANESSDADSFNVRAGGREYVFRLYFVDAPETDNSFPDRVDEQAKYFGVTSTQALQLGLHAKNFTREKLVRPFTVRTCRQDAMGRSALGRFYAFVETAEGDLAELLVANGLAPVYGSAATPVGLSSPDREWRKLQRLEREAKGARVGGWGAANGRMTARLPRPPGKTGPGSFEAFFRPERGTPAVHENASSSPASAAAPLSGGKIDVNSATSTELLNLPGLGPVLAQRVIDARPFMTADDLRKVKGIGPKKYEALRPFFH